MQSKDKPDSNFDPLSDSAQTNKMITPQLVTADSDQSRKVSVKHAGIQQVVSELQPKISTYPVATTRSVMQPLPLVEQLSESERSLREWLSIWWEGIRPAYLALSFLPVVSWRYCSMDTKYLSEVSTRKLPPHQVCYNSHRCALASDWRLSHQ